MNKNIWLILVLIVVIVVAIVVINRQRAKKQDLTSQLQTINNYIYQNENKSTSTTQGASGNSSSSTSNTPTIAKIGDKIYAGATGANLYKSTVASPSNVLKYFGPGQQIGTYLSTDGSFTKITTLNPNFGFTDFNIYITAYAITSQTRK